MNFEVGQEVVIRKTLKPEGAYYHGGYTNRVPLGTKAVIDEMLDRDKIHIKFKSKGPGNSGYWYVHPDELTTSNEQEKIEGKRQKKVDCLLEKALTESDVQIKDNGNGTREFNPKFNAREEFAVWIRQEFPDLPANTSYVRYDYSNGGPNRIYYSGSYCFPKKRREEVFRAAKMACEHGIETTDKCIRAYFRDCLGRLDTDFDGAVFCLLNLIENVSISLPHEKTHYGTSVPKGVLKE